MSNRTINLGTRLQGNDRFLEIQSVNSDNFDFDANSQLNLADSLTVQDITVNGTFTNAGGGSIGGASATYTTSITTPKIIFTDNLSEGLTIEAGDGADYMTFDSTNGSEHIDILKDVNTGGNKITMGTNGSRGIIQYANIKNSTIDNTNTLSANTTGTASAWTSNMTLNLANPYTGQLMNSVSFNGSNTTQLDANYIDDSNSNSHRFVLQNINSAHTNVNLQTRIEFLNQYQSGMVNSNNRVAIQSASSGQFTTIVYDTGHASNFSELRLLVDYPDDIPSFNNFVFWDTMRDGERFMKLVNLNTTYENSDAQRQYPTSIHLGNGGDFKDTVVGNTFAKIKANWRAEGQGQLKLLARRTASSAAQECGFLITDNAGSNAIQQNQQTNNMIVSGQQIDGFCDIKYFNGCAIGNSSHLGNGLEYKDSVSSVISGASTGYDNTLELKLADDTLQTSGSGLSVKFSGTSGLQEATGNAGLEVKLKSGGGLDVDANGLFVSSAASSDEITDADGSAKIEIATNDQIVVKTNSANRMLINDDGRFSINNQFRMAYTTITAPNQAKVALADIQDYLLLLGGGSQSSGGSVVSYGLGFGAVNANTDHPPAYIKYDETNIAGDSKGRLVFGARSSTTGTDTLDTMWINDGKVGVGTNFPKSLLNTNNTLSSSDNTIRPSNSGNTNYPTESLWLGKSTSSLSNYWGMSLGTIYNGYSYIQAMNTATTSYYSLFLNPHGGTVGINTTTQPAVPLQVIGYGNPPTSGFGFLWNFSDIYARTDFNNVPNAARISIEAQYSVKCMFSVIASDIRIKKDFEDVNDGEALNIINSLEIVKYNYKDETRNNELKTIGFKAQQVNEVLPNAVKIKTDVLDDIMLNVIDPVWEDNKLIYEVDLSGDEYTGNVKFMVLDGEKEEEKIVKYEDGGFVFEKQYDKLICIGREVNNYHLLNKDVIFGVGMSAIQELSRKVDLLETQNGLLQTENNSLLEQTQVMEDRINSLETLLTSLTNRVRINETTLQGLIINN